MANPSVENFSKNPTTSPVLPVENFSDNSRPDSSRVSKRQASSSAKRNNNPKVNSPEISVLVPIMNVEKYLPECLDSLKNQTLKDLEFILIDDGSTDSSPEILRNFVKTEPRAKLLTKKNTGYGDSLNQGLKLATGPYIAIVEPDDFVSLDAFEKLFELALSAAPTVLTGGADAGREKAQNGGASFPDIIRANFFDYSENSEKLHSGHTKTGLASASEIVDLLREQPAIWSAIYRREFLFENQIEFLPTPGASYQDAGFFLKTLGCAKTVMLDKNAYYHYRIDNSSSSVKSAKKVNNVIEEYHSAEDFLRDRVSLDFMQSLEAAKFAAYAWNIARLPRETALDFAKRAQTEFRKLQRKNLLNPRYFRKKYWFSLKLLLISPHLFVDIIFAHRSFKKNS